MTVFAVAVCPGQSLEFVTMGICDGQIDSLFMCRPGHDRIDLELPFVLPADIASGAWTATVKTPCGCFDIFLHVTCPPVIIKGRFDGKTSRQTVETCCD